MHSLDLQRLRKNLQMKQIALQVKDLLQESVFHCLLWHKIATRDASTLQYLIVYVAGTNVARGRAQICFSQ